MSLGRLTYQETKRVLKSTDEDMARYIKNKRLVPIETVYPGDSLFEIQEVRAILQEEQGVDILSTEVLRILYCPEIRDAVEIEAKEYMEMGNIAERYGYDEATIKTWVAQDRIRALRDPDGTVKVRVKDFLRMFAGQIDQDQAIMAARAMDRAQNVEDKITLVVNRVKSIYRNAMQQVAKEMSVAKELEGGVDLGWFRVDKCYEGCILGEKEVCILPVRGDRAWDITLYKTVDDQAGSHARS